MDSQTDSILFLTDESDQPARIGFHVVANGVTYHLTGLKLNPHETRAINIRKLRDAQKADFLKNRIPADASDGSVEWNRIDNVAVTGRVVVIQKNQGTVSGYDCCTCPCPESYHGLSVTPAPSYINVGGNVLLSATATYQACNNGPKDYCDVSTQATWTSGTPSVAVMNPNDPGEADGLAAGSSSITAKYSDYVYSGTTCTANLAQHQGSATVNVVWVTLSLRASGTLSSDDFATPTMTSILGTSNLHTLMDTDGYWVTPVEVVGNVVPSTYTGAITIRRQLLGVYVYDNCTLVLSQGPRDDTSDYPLYDDDPQSGGSAGKVYDTDEPGIQPLSSDTVNHVYHYRANFYEYAQTTINGVVRTVSSNLNWFARVSYLKTSSGSQLSTSISGDNVAGTGTTKTSCNLQ